MAPHKVPQLSGIRMPAFVMIFLTHAGFHGFFLWSAVDLYFVLSGLLITGILLRQNKGEGFFRVFYSRRFLRIFPPFYLVLILSILALGHVDAGQALAIATFTANFYMPLSDLNTIPPSYWAIGPYWTLGVEEQFYLIWPWLVYKLSPRRMLAVCIALIIAAPICRGLGHIFLRDVLNHQWLFMLTWNRVDLLAAGASIALIRHLDLAPAPVMAKGGLWLMGGCAAAIAACAFSMADFRQSGQGFFFCTVGLSLFCGLMTGLISYLANASGGPIIRFLSLRPMVYMGTITYTTYLAHGTVIALVHEWFGTPAGWQMVAIAYPITILVAIIFWHALEAPIQRLKDAKL